MVVSVARPTLDVVETVEFDAVRTAEDIDEGDPVIVRLTVLA